MVHQWFNQDGKNNLFYTANLSANKDSRYSHRPLETSGDLHKYRWVVQLLVVISVVVVPQLGWLKLDFTNDRYWLLGHEVSQLIAIQSVVILWLGTFFINFFENYFVGRLLCGWICPWGLLNRLGLLINHRLRRCEGR